MLRETKGLTQADIQRRTGLRRSYISRVEHGFKVPQVETLKKFSIALKVPLSEILDQDEGHLELPRFLERSDKGKFAASGESKEARYIAKLIRTVARISEPNKRVLLSIAQKMARRA